MPCNSEDEKEKPTILNSPSLNREQIKIKHTNSNTMSNCSILYKIRHKKSSYNDAKIDINEKDDGKYEDFKAGKPMNECVNILEISNGLESSTDNSK